MGVARLTAPLVWTWPFRIPNAEKRGMLADRKISEQATLISGTQRYVFVRIGPPSVCQTGRAKTEDTPPPEARSVLVSPEIGPVGGNLVQAVSPASANVPLANVMMVPPTAVTYGSVAGYPACSGLLGLYPLVKSVLGLDPPSPEPATTVMPAAAICANT